MLLSSLVIAWTQGPVGFEQRRTSYARWLCRGNASHPGQAGREGRSDHPTDEPGAAFYARGACCLSSAVPAAGARRNKGPSLGRYAAAKCFGNTDYDSCVSTAAKGEHHLSDEGAFADEGQHHLPATHCAETCVEHLRSDRSFRQHVVWFRSW